MKLQPFFSLPHFALFLRSSKMQMTICVVEFVFMFLISFFSSCFFFSFLHFTRTSSSFQFCSLVEWRRRLKTVGMQFAVVDFEWGANEILINFSHHQRKVFKSHGEISINLHVFGRLHVFEGCILCTVHIHMSYQFMPDEKHKIRFILRNFHFWPKQFFVIFFVVVVVYLQKKCWRMLVSHLQIVQTTFVQTNFIRRFVDFTLPNTLKMHATQSLATADSTLTHVFELPVFVEGSFACNGSRQFMVRWEF